MSASAIRPESIEMIMTAQMVEQHHMHRQASPKIQIRRRAVTSGGAQGFLARDFEHSIHCGKGWTRLRIRTPSVTVVYLVARHHKFMVNEVKLLPLRGRKTRLSNLATRLVEQFQIGLRAFPNTPNRPITT